METGKVGVDTSVGSGTRGCEEAAAIEMTRDQRARANLPLFDSVTFESSRLATGGRSQPRPPVHRPTHRHR